MALVEGCLSQYECRAHRNNKFHGTRPTHQSHCSPPHFQYDTIQWQYVFKHLITLLALPFISTCSINRLDGHQTLVHSVIVCKSFDVILLGVIMCEALPLGGRHRHRCVQRHCVCVVCRHDYCNRNQRRAALLDDCWFSTDSKVIRLDYGVPGGF